MLRIVWASILIGIEFCTYASAGQPDRGKVGTSAPGFSLLTVERGERVQPDQYLGNPVLLSFIQIHSSSQAALAQGTRAQMTFVKSMVDQYAAKGLKTIFIAAQYPHLSASLDEETLINFLYDHELTDIPLLKDDQASNVVSRYDVKMLPTTFLISANGMIVQRWDDVALTSQLAQAIEYELERDPSGVKLWPTPAQTIFPGIPPARPLAENIWLVDGGKDWEHNHPQPVRLLVWGEETLRTTLEIIGTDGETASMMTLSLEPLPEDECSILLSNVTTEATAVYETVSSIAITKPGNYTLRVRTGENKHFSGDVKITVH